MEKIINQILDLPQMLNQKLPKNCFNEMMDNSEGSVSDWTGKIFKVGALVVLVGMLVSVFNDGMEAVSGAEGIGKVSAGLCALILNICSISNCSGCKICRRFFGLVKERYGRFCI